MLWQFWATGVYFNMRSKANMSQLNLPALGLQDS